MLRNCENVASLKRKACLGSCWACISAFLSSVCWSLFSAAVWRSLLQGLCGYGFPNFIPVGVHFGSFYRLGMEKRLLKLRLEKWCIFGSNLFGAGRRGGPPGNLLLKILLHSRHILIIIIIIHARSATPLGLRRILRFRPCRQPPLWLLMGWLLIWMILF